MLVKVSYRISNCYVGVGSLINVIQGFYGLLYGGWVVIYLIFYILQGIRYYVDDIDYYRLLQGGKISYKDISEVIQIVVLSEQFDMYYKSYCIEGGQVGN